VLAKPQPIDDNYVKILRVESTGPAFRFLRIRLEFEARAAVYFPAGKAGNIFRGALGECLRDVACVPSCRDSKTCEWKQDCLYSSLFEPQSELGPSGYRDLPRPFVLRPYWQAEKRVSCDERFFLDVHVFDRDLELLNTLLLAFSRFGEKGIGPGRPKALLLNANALDEFGHKVLDLKPGARTGEMLDVEISITLNDEIGDVGIVDVSFDSPLSLKQDGAIVYEPEFNIVFRRLTERIGILDRSFGSSSVSTPVENLKAADAVSMEVLGGRIDSHSRRSGRTGHRQSLAGFVGNVRYRGVTASMMRWLAVGRWVGVGRQTVWGNGAFQISELNLK